ncbi:MAG: hypothetical protein QM652_06330 [Legionella sp.]|uniref:hypothetical protein n=1 Tax=Legionella sp. TaxID=459 RepID=UPI0039E2CDCF
MSKLNADGMKQVNDAETSRMQELSELCAKKFSIHNKKQIADLKKYLDEFKFATYQMYLFQGFSSGLTLFGTTPTSVITKLLGARIVIYFLPIPEFIKIITTLTIGLSILSSVLKNFNMTNYFNQLVQMQQLYNWCLKGGKADYDGRDNNEILNLPEVQEMIRILAPLCTPLFMQAWPDSQNKQTSIYHTARNIGTGIYHTFFSASQEASDQLKILQRDVEEGKMELSAFQASLQAIEYFTTDKRFRELMAQKVGIPINFVNNIVSQTSEIINLRPKMS